MNPLISPEHLHVALNHIPFLGAGFALVPLAVGFFTRNRMAVFAGLLTAALSGWMIPVVMGTGEAAYERYERNPAARNLDTQAETYLEAHEHRAEAWSKVIYASAALSTVCLGLCFWKPGWVRRLAAPAALLCAAALLSGIFIAESGGLIRRPDFRPGGAGVSSGAAAAPSADEDKAGGGHGGRHHDDD